MAEAHAKHHDYHLVDPSPWPFVGSVSAFIMAFGAIFPNVLPAANDPALSLTVMNASSTEYTLRVMTIATVILLPIVLAYQAWAYWVFRARVTGEGFPSAHAANLARKAKEGYREAFDTES